jgi:hypothetical protein
MNAGLPPDAAFDEAPAVAHYELPDWPDGRARRARSAGLLGAAIVCISLIFAVPLGFMVSMSPPPVEVVAPVAALAAFSLAAGSALLLYAGRGAPGRDWLVLDEHGIKATWQAGPFRRSRQVAWDEIVQLAIVPARNVAGFEVVNGGFLLIARRARGGPVRLAGDEDRDRLLALAAEVARRTGRSPADSDEAWVGSLPKVVEENDRGAVVDRDHPPAGSTAILKHHADGVTITIPRQRFSDFIHDPHGPGLVSILVVVVLLAGWIAFGSAPAIARNGIIGLFAFEGALLAWPVALVPVVLLTSVLGRQAEISTRGGVLTVCWTDLLGKHRRSWPREALVDVRAVSKLVDDDGGKAWTQYLDIRPLDSRPSAPRGCLHWREKAELEWIATTIRRSLSLPAKGPHAKPVKEGLNNEIA